MDKYYYEYEAGSDYCYPGTSVLINKLNIRNNQQLSEAERRFTAVTVLEVMSKPVRGSFDLKHLMDIHKAIFGDIYEWAGKLRTVNIAKGNQFCQCTYLVDYADELFSKLKAERFLIDTAPEELPERLSFYLSEINVLHPFREGNGRTQRVFMDYLARYNGYHLNFAHVSDSEMIEASATAFDMDYTKLNQMVARILEKTSDEEQSAFCRAIKTRRR
jgi:cell filamentation protein